MSNSGMHRSTDSLVPDWERFRDTYQTGIQYRSYDQLADHLRNLIPNSGNVLDVGCGDGRLALALAKSAGTIFGVDTSYQLISAAEHQRQQARIENVHFLLGDVAQIPLGDAEFDLVVSSFAIHHVDVEAVLTRLTRALRPGGWLYLQEPTCPVDGMLRPLWYRWNALQRLAPMIKSVGLMPAFKMQRRQQSRAWIDHQVADKHWPAEKWQMVAQALLPGVSVKVMADHVIALWQRPQALSEDKSHAATSLADAVPSRITVKRQYPMPAPDAYVPFPREVIEGSVIERFEAQVDQHAHRIALRTPSLQLTYAQFNATANRIGRQVLAHSGRSKAPVALLMDQDDPVIPTLFGVLKTGLPYVVIDPADPVERQQRIINLAGAELLVTTAARVSKSVGDCVEIDRRLLYEEMAYNETEDNLGLALTADHLAAIFFTSGSTGEPKGVARDHRQFLHSTWLNTNTYFVAPTDRQSLLYFPGFTASVPNIYDTLLNGATLCSLNPRNLSASMLLEWLHSEQITHFNPPIGLWRGLVEATTPGATWPNLRLVTLAGQPLYSKDIREFQATFGQQTTLLYVLAMTEAGAVTQAYIDHSTVSSGEGAVPVGYPVADKQIVIRNEQGEVAEPGETGQIAITSAYLSLGYWQNEAETRERFRSLSNETSQRTFLSSDRGALHADGCLEFYGRTDAIVKVRGYRVDLTAIEAVLNAHPQIVQSAVVVHTRLSGDARLVAYLSNRKDNQASGPTLESLRTHLTQTLPPYMIPDR